jgi:small-conductance mechanosensitive channel
MDVWKNLNTWQLWLVFGGTLVVSVCAALIAHYLLARILRGIARRTASKVDNLLLERLYQPVRWIMVAGAVGLAIQAFAVSEGPTELLTHIFAVVLIVLVAWLLIRVTSALSEVVLLAHPMDGSDNLRARAIRTQISIVRRTLIVVIITVALSSLLMTFPRVRQLGAAILASAGIAGIVLGLAAQKTLGNFFAGLQIALTQPLRIDDVVIVEGEWGRIEEITLTYVVVKIWDLRRLIVPITYFIEHPFQNWTRVTANILGTVVLYVDYTVPVEAVRTELQRVLESTNLWDHKLGLLQVTNVSERAAELRVLVSAPDAGTAWDLRCYVREKLVAFIQEHYPQSLPKVRAELPKGPPEAELSADLQRRE